MATRKVDLDRAATAAPTTGSALPGLINAFSVDVEEYFHDETFRERVPQSQWESLQQRAEPSTRLLLQMLDGFGVKGTFFVLGWVAERQPQLVRDIHARGHEVAIHGYDHRPVFVLDRDEFRSDIRRAKETVEDLIGEPVIGYRAPTFSIVEDTWWALEILVEEGIQYDSSVFPIVHDRYGVPDADRFPHTLSTPAGDLVEFPMSTIRLGRRNFPFAGGGYTRIFPMRFVRWGMRRVIEKEGRATVLYVHPWEVDPDHPVLDASRTGRARHYHGLAKVEHRLQELLSAYRFGTIREVLGL